MHLAGFPGCEREGAVLFESWSAACTATTGLIFLMHRPHCNALQRPAAPDWNPEDSSGLVAALSETRLLQKNCFLADFAARIHGIQAKSEKQSCHCLWQARPADAEPSVPSVALPKPARKRYGFGALRGWSWRGRYSPVHQLVKKTFLTS